MESASHVPTIIDPSHAFKYVQDIEMTSKENQTKGGLQVGEAGIHQVKMSGGETDDTDYSHTAESTESFPDTQPFQDINECSNDAAIDRVVWGHLVPTNKFFRSFSLEQNVTLFGKTQDGNQQMDAFYEFGEDEFPVEFWSQLSRHHFLIRRFFNDDGDEDVFITDLSFNGTFVNGERLVKGQTRPLVNKDQITLVNPSRGGFTLILSSYKEYDDFGQVPIEIHKDFILGRRISEGVAGKVFIGYRRRDMQKFALKFMRNTVPASVVFKEVQILRTLRHVNIIGFERFISSDRFFVIVMEFASGGELFNYVLDDYNNASFDEGVAKLQFYQILHGVDFMHDKLICHRDLKLENLLMKRKDRRSLIKIADFGLSKMTKNTKLMTSYVGTPNYIAPEVLKNGENIETGYDLSADMWSLGCILFSLLCGSPAFNGENEAEVKSRILQGAYNVNLPMMKDISFLAKDLVQRLLKVEPEQRLSVKDALRHPWFYDTAMQNEYNSLVRESEENSIAIPKGVRQIARGVKKLNIMSPVHVAQPVKRQRSTTSSSDDEDKENGHHALKRKAL